MSAAPKPDMSAPSAHLDDIHDRMTRLKDSMIAAEQIADNSLRSDGGPLFAVIQISVMEARHLDRLVDELWESPSLALKVLAGDQVTKSEKS